MVIPGSDVPLISSVLSLVMPSEELTPVSVLILVIVGTTSAALNLKNFFDHLAPRMPEAVYLVGIQAGTEVFTGSGTLETSLYSVELAGG
jgi:hypothetical protein